MITCKRCEKSLSEENFKSYNRSTCRKCLYARERNRMIAYQRERRARLPRRELAYSEIKSRYGVTREQFDRAWRDQKGLCAICSNPPSGIGKSGMMLHVDHDHKTGKFRGLLCSSCNRGLGFFLERTDLLYGAIAYLQFHIGGLPVGLGNEKSLEGTPQVN